jgi:hypothetical protein
MSLQTLAERVLSSSVTLVEGRSDVMRRRRRGNFACGVRMASQYIEMPLSQCVVLSTKPRMECHIGPKAAAPDACNMIVPEYRDGSGGFLAF